MASDAVLRPTNLTTVAGIEYFYRQLDEAVSSFVWPEPLTIDLSWIPFVYPESIIALITAARLWHRETGEPARLHGIRTQVHKYLERMDLFTQCAAWLEEETALRPEERYDRSPASSTLLEVLPIAGEEESNADDVAAAVERAEHILETWFGADAAAVGRLLTMLAEIGSNVIHSQNRGFAVIQRYQDPDSRPLGSRVTIAVGDFGIGIEASLRDKATGRAKADMAKFGPGSDYILHALELGVTSRPGAGGMGLYQVRGLVEEWKGSLIIRSKRSMVHISTEATGFRDDLAEIAGTQVAISVRGTLDMPF